MVLDPGNIQVTESEFSHGSNLMPTDDQMALIAQVPLHHETLRAVHRACTEKNSLDAEYELDYTPDQG
jgi:hypothetical protein